MVHVEVIHGGYTNVKVPVAICPRYEGMALAGPAKEFDRQMDGWLTRAVDLGMIGSGLGQLFPVNLQVSREAGRVKVDSLLLVGMGQPGEFAADDLRYLMQNVTVAVNRCGTITLARCSLARAERAAYCSVRRLGGSSRESSTATRGSARSPRG